VTGGGMAFAESSHPEDELFVISFNERVRHALPPTQPFTSSRPLLRATLAGLHAGGQTALYDAVIEALDHVEKATHQKHVIIVLSDGEDNASRHRREEMYDRAARSDAIIYAVATSDPRFGGGGDPGVLRKLARIGGGMAFFPRSREEVVTVLMETAENIRRGYSIGYTPTNLERDGRFRRIKVMVRANGRSLTARYRDGYTAPGPSSTK
jgi:Ca-activated chloride channel family protein